MSYVTAENALETILLTVTGFSATNVSKGDYRILGKGSETAIVLNPGSFSRRNLPPGEVTTDWTILLELFIGFTGEISTIASNIRTQRQNIINKIDTYPTLNRASGVLLGELSAGDEPELWAMGSRQWWRQVMRVTVREATIVTYAE